MIRHQMLIRMLNHGTKTRRSLKDPSTLRHAVLAEQHRAAVADHDRSRAYQQNRAQDNQTDRRYHDIHGTLDQTLLEGKLLHFRRDHRYSHQEPPRASAGPPRPQPPAVVEYISPYADSRRRQFYSYHPPAHYSEKSYRPSSIASYQIRITPQLNRAFHLVLLLVLSDAAAKISQIPASRYDQAALRVRQRRSRSHDRRK